MRNIINKIGIKRQYSNNINHSIKIQAVHNLRVSGSICHNYMSGQVSIIAYRYITSEHIINIHSIIQDLLLILSANTNCHM